MLPLSRPRSGTSARPRSAGKARSTHGSAAPSRVSFAAKSSVRVCDSRARSNGPPKNSTRELPRSATATCPTRASNEHPCGPANLPCCEAAVAAAAQTDGLTVLARASGFAAHEAAARTVKGVHTRAAVAVAQEEVRRVGRSRERRGR
eukprot:4533058-Prymnesium_polylepis.1